MNRYDDLRARALLSRIGEPGNLRLARMVDQIGAATLVDRLFAEGVAGVGRADLAMRMHTVDPERELAQAARLGIRFVIPSDAEWPIQLGDLGQPDTQQECGGGVPIGLWVKGPLRLDQLPRSLAIVGSRSCTTYGDSLAFEIAASVAHAGVPVVSGGAIGIDRAGHRGAIAAEGQTIAVLACGVDRTYPQENAALLRHIGETGALVSEVPPGCVATKSRFLVRNRLIAALSVGTVVVEAAIRSGALNTLRWAGSLNRVVMGVPGPVTSAQSQGVLERIRTGAANLVTSGPEALELIGAAGEHLVTPARAPARRRDALTRRDQQILDAVPKCTRRPADSIARAAGIAVLDVGTTLARLHRGGLVSYGDGGWQLTTGAGE